MKLPMANIFAPYLLGQIGLVGNFFGYPSASSFSKSSSLPIRSNRISWKLIFGTGKPISPKKEPYLLGQIGLVGNMIDSGKINSDNIKCTLPIRSNRISWKH